MMRTLRSLILMAIAALPIIGCRTPQPGPQHEGSFADVEQSSSPFLSRGEYPDRLGRAVEEALRNHWFTIPWIVARGTDGATWFVAERFHGDTRFDRIYVRVVSEQEVTTTITAYQFHGSDWATLGRLFVGADYRAEAASITSEVRKSLWENRERLR